MTEKHMTQAAQHPFDTLVQTGMQAQTADEQQRCLTALWRAFLQLEHWYFVTTTGADIAHAQPFIGVVDGQPSAIVFTDAGKAAEFAGDQPRFRNPDGHFWYITQPLPGAVDWLLALPEHGIHSIQVNRGPYGWFGQNTDLLPLLAEYRSDIANSQ